MRANAFARVVAALAVTLTLLAPDVAVAAPSARDLATRVRALDAKLVAVGRSYERAYWRLDETDVRLARIDKSMKVATKELDEASIALSNRADFIYRRGASDYLEILLTAQDFSDLIERAEYVRRVTEADAAAIARVKRLRRKLTAQRQALGRERRERASAVASLRSRRDEARGALAAAKADYASLKAQLDAAVRNELRRYGRSSWTPPRGPNGMIFPVAGPNYYADTWGASRSGGRRSHKGTDIMAGNGTPCVAVLSGTVRAKNGGLGGKTIWLTADNGWQFYYAHLSGWEVTSGHVRAGQVIGYVGDTGNAQGGADHLHFQIHPGGGGPVNPYPYLRAMQ